MLESLLVPTAIVALAEIGDKTQLLALILAARFRKPWPIIAGIVAATLANHAAAGAVGAWFGSFFSDSALHWILAASFTATALWTLVPDKMDDDENPARRFGPFLTTLIAFFLAEIGDKTQLLALILAARFRKPWPIIAGIVAATLANHAAAGAVGAWFSSFFSDAMLHWILAASFTATALWTLVPDKMDDDEATTAR
ncbi:MAG: TMEM165/GDT1 family protein, partial [Pseudomonas putida]